MAPITLVALIALQAPVPAQDVFVSGRLDPSVPYDTFRIPALCRTAKGTLLAFAEGRNSVTDQSSNVLVLRRREKNRAEWGPLQRIAADPPHSLNNPCVLATRAGTVWLMYQRYPKGLDERTAEPGLSPDRSCLTYVIHSEDDGKTWSRPLDISPSIKAATSQSLASGPGVGIEITRGPHRGRLVFPFNEGAGGTYDAFAVFSDDGGRSFRGGGKAPRVAGTNPNENQIAELAGGDLYMNARNQAQGRFRLTSLSHDGGQTWTTAEPDPTLRDPICQGSTVRLSFEPDVLAFSNPNDSKERRNGTLRFSFDGGKSWPKSWVVVPGSFAYSCLCPLSKRSAGILYESTERLPDGREGYRIRFVTLDLSGISSRIAPQG